MIAGDLFAEWAAQTVEPLIVTDAEGRTLWINGAFQSMCGYTLPELAGKRPGHLLRGEMTDRDAVSRIREAIRARRPCTEDLLNYHKNGKVYRAELTITPITGADNQIINFVGVARERTMHDAAADHTAHDDPQVNLHATCVCCRRVRTDGGGWQQIERWINERTGAEFAHTICTDCRTRVARCTVPHTPVDVVRLCNEFLMLVSHELRTPLTPILGWASIMLDRDDTSESTRRAFEVIRRNALHQQRLVENLLDLAQAHSGALKLDRKPMNLPREIERAIAAACEEASAKSVQFNFVIDDTNVEIVGDTARMCKIVSSLASNAVKFTPSGGEIEVRLVASEDWVEIIVRDSGAGIMPEFLPYAFDPFTRADGRTTREHGGAGLGLAISRHFAELHGGTIKVSSTSAGATFVVRLPRA